ncbi:hypothetical protein OO012_16250 [Rhodobacteraceae bacterium KMM 6894]|nr:hypothetical protein [Rhodobacteraceae bacterium KMM 6894]
MIFPVFWMLLSENGGQVTAWNGLIDLGRRDTLVVCVGVNAAAGSTRQVLGRGSGWLARNDPLGVCQRHV